MCESAKRDQVDYKLKHSLKEHLKSADHSVTWTKEEEHSETYATEITAKLIAVALMLIKNKTAGHHYSNSIELLYLCGADIGTKCHGRYSTP